MAWLVTPAAVAVVFATGWLDLVTGPEIGMSLFYILPIAFVAWRLGAGPAAIVVAGASACWLAADAAWRADGQLGVWLWNGGTRLVIYAFVAFAMSTIRADRQRLRGLLRAAEDASRTDALTGLANTRAFHERLEAEIARARRAGGGLSLGYVDLDCFKKVNDKHGHGAGDEVLRRVAGALRSSLREVDVAARLGGDEFAVLFVDADAAGAVRAAERILAAVNEVARDYPDTGLGASIGVASFTAPASAALAGASDGPLVATGADAIVKAADEAMYRAKAAGKGTIVHEEHAALAQPS